MPDVRFMTRADRAYRREKIITMLKVGRPDQQVAEYFGISREYVKQIRREAGIILHAGRPKASVGGRV